MILERFSLKGKRALVTGGAGLYGRQIVRALAEGGARVVMASRNLEALEKVAAEFREAGFDVRAMALDQGDPQSCTALRDELRADSGGLDILVNNAVVRPARGGSAGEAAQLVESMRVNAAGLIVLTETLGEILSDGGSIINIGSIMGLVGIEPLNYRGTDMAGWMPDYYFHKGGMVNLTRYHASRFGSRGIRVNAVHPGGLGSMNQPEAFVTNYCERTCLGRLAGDSDLMGVIVFLASDASTYITGANIPVDGGYTAK